MRRNESESSFIVQSEKNEILFIFQIRNNICLNSVGHGFFIEDGGEKHTLFEGNLALGQRSWTGLINHPITGALPSDR
jgi:hypothetical protein